ncbi:discoidin domain-containing protein [Colwellia sp. MEBiC06753]
MNKAKNFRLTLPMMLVASALSACGGSNDPDAQDVPVTPDNTAAEVAGSVIKGTLSGASINVTPLNGTTLTAASQAVTDANGQFFVELNGKPGFGIDSLVKITVTADAGASMICDAPVCAGINLGGVVSGAFVEGTQLTTLSQLAVPYGNNADGQADLVTQANALTTLATQLIEQAIADGRNVSSPDLLALAQAEYSALLLRALGWQTNNTNVFTTPVVSAESYHNFVTGNSCELAESGEEVCADTLVTESQIKLSFLNAAFSQFDETSSQAANLQLASENLSAALAGDPEALTALREGLYQAIDRHEVASELGFSASAIIDLGLALFDAESTGGPIHEISTPDNIAAATITARFSISESESQYQLFDGDVETKWLDHNDWQGAPTEADPSWMQIDFAEPQAINTMVITSANDAPARDPENFTLVASNDGGETWVTLLDVKGASFDERFQAQSFAFANELKYSSYRFNVTKNAGNDGLMQIAEINFLGPIYTSLVHSHSGVGVASARNSIGDAENQDKAFDGDVNTKWLDHNDWLGAPSEADPSWIQMDFPEAVAVNVVAITSANDASSRDPENFQLLASNDGSNWEVVGDWVGEAFDQRFERKEFRSANQLAYTSYRLNITKNSGNDGLVQIAEVEFIGPELPSLDHSVMAGASYSARFAISDAESAAQAFDRNVETKWLDHNDWQGAPTEADPAWIQVDLPSAQVVNTLTITSANDAPARDPENFTLSASNDGGETWVVVGSWVGEAFDDRFERKTFSFANTLAYGSYRLNVTKNAGNDGLMQVAEVGLIGPQYAAINHATQAGAIYSARNRIGDAESEAKAFDGDVETKWLDHNDWLGAPSEEDPSWIQVDLLSPQIVSSLAIVSANDAPERDAENFQLLGSNDGGATWKTVASWVGESWDERFERKQFDFVNGFAYSSYRLNITKNKNNDGLVQIAEIELIGIEQ